jgi:hypothetical protein
MFHGERGQVAPLLALLAVGVGLACLALGRFGADAVDHARARTAADAAALAGAESAARLAAANGAVVESVEAAGADVRVRVRAGVATASARARHPQPRAPATALGDGLAPVVRAALARAAQVLGEPVPVTSGFRARPTSAASGPAVRPTATRWRRRARRCTSGAWPSTCPSPSPTGWRPSAPAPASAGPTRRPIRSTSSHVRRRRFPRDHPG